MFARACQSPKLALTVGCTSLPPSTVINNAITKCKLLPYVFQCSKVPGAAAASLPHALTRTGGRAKAWRFLIHAKAFLSHSYPPSSNSKARKETFMRCSRSFTPPQWATHARVTNPLPAPSRAALTRSRTLSPLLRNPLSPHNFSCDLWRGPTSAEASSGGPHCNPPWMRAPAKHPTQFCSQ
jgi:hypothetical protein